MTLIYKVHYHLYHCSSVLQLVWLAKFHSIHNEIHHPLPDRSFYISWSIFSTSIRNIVVTCSILIVGLFSWCDHLIEVIFLLRWPSYWGDLLIEVTFLRWYFSWIDLFIEMIFLSRGFLDWGSRFIVVIVILR